MNMIDNTIEINTPSEFVKVKGKIINNSISYITFKQGLKVNYTNYRIITPLSNLVRKIFRDGFG